MRRYVYLILFALILGLPFLVRALVTRGQRTAKVHADEYIVVVTPHTQDIRREFERAFHAWHLRKYGQSVGIDYRTPGGSNDVKRLLESTYGAYRDSKTGQIAADIPVDIDVAFGGGDYFFDQELKRMGVLQPIHFADPGILRSVFPKGQETLAGVKLCDLTYNAKGELTPLWVGVCLSAFGIVYNPDLYDTLGLPPPEKWADLTDPKLNNLIELADPTHSGSAATAYITVIQRRMADAEEELFARQPALRAMSQADLARNPEYRAAVAAGWKKGMGELLLIVANARHFTDSSSQVPNDVGDGQAAVGVAIDFYGRVYQESVGRRRCSVVMPRAATAITPDTVGILYGVKGRRLELALHFVEFLLSPEGQRLWDLQPGQSGGPIDRSLRRPPIRRDVYANRTGWADPDVDPFAESGGFNQRAQWMSLLTDTRTIWTIAWLDHREALKRAYESALAVPDETRRRHLIEKLSQLPIELKDVEEMAAQRKQHEKSGDADEWNARQRIAWGDKFRQHYDDVARAAEESNHR